MAASRANQTLTVLVASTIPWEFPARVALAFDELGWRVEAACWRHHPLRAARAVRRVHQYSPLRPVQGLASAIAAAAPDLVVPCDDRVLDHLLAVHRACEKVGDAATAGLIVRSIGEPARSASVRARAALIALAREAGARAPLTLPVDDSDGLRAAIEQVGLPAVLKSDGSWGGIGVGVAATMAEAEDLFARLSRKPSPLRALKRLIVNRDPYPLIPSIGAGRPRVNVQAYVRGRPANCLAACRDGEVLALVQAAVEQTEHDLGPSAIVRVIDHPDIQDAANRVFGALRLSGFAGLDFVIEDGTGAAHLVEMNQRVTPTGHLALGEGRDPVGALTASFMNVTGAMREPMTRSDLIAFFPMAWQVSPPSPLLAEAYHDVPWTDPALARELIRPPVDERGLLSRLIDRRLLDRSRPADAVRLEPVLVALLAAHAAQAAEQPEPIDDDAIFEPARSVEAAS